VTDVSELARAYARSRAYVESLAARQRADDLSEFWAEHFSARVNFPSFNDMQVLRRGGFTYGVGEVRPGADEAAERDWAAATWHVVQSSTPVVDLADWPESSVGAPYVFDLDGHRRSGSAVINALTSQRVVEWCRRLGLDRPLRVLEIGPGYGQGAVQLIERLPIASYAICDLPENLFLSSYYLQTAQSKLPVSFVTEAENTAEGIVFATPPDLERLPGPFDLVVNAYSLQEMNLQSVQAYYAFIAENLAEDGLFYSLNAHGKAGVATPSDYAVELFDVCSFGPLRRYPFFVFATEPYELVLRRSTGREFWKPGFDTLARLLQIGFQTELSELCAALVENTVDDSQRRWFAAAAAVVSAPTHEQRCVAVEAMRGSGPRAVADLVSGLVTFARGGDDGEVAARLDDALAELEPSGARVRALTVRAALTGDSAPIDEIAALAPHLASEATQFARDRLTLRVKVAELLGLTAPPRPPLRAALGRLRRTLPIG
jgi:putative sugar O-methyltransferase